MGKQDSGRRYLRGVALSLMGQVGISVHHFRDEELRHGSFPQLLWSRFGEKVESLMGNTMSAATLGRISAYGESFGAAGCSGKTALYDLHCGSWLDKYESGWTLLLKLAATTVVAEMSDILETRR